jgi:hypothetical protein
LLVAHADLAILSDAPWNDMVVVGRSSACIGNLGFRSGEEDYGSDSLPWSHRKA